MWRGEPKQEQRAVVCKQPRLRTRRKSSRLKAALRADGGSERAGPERGKALKGSLGLEEGQKAFH